MSAKIEAVSFIGMTSGIKRVALARKVKTIPNEAMITVEYSCTESNGFEIMRVYVHLAKERRAYFDSNAGHVGIVKNRSIRVPAKIFHGREYPAFTKGVKHAHYLTKSDVRRLSPKVSAAIRQREIEEEEERQRNERRKKRAERRRRRAEVRKKVAPVKKMLAKAARQMFVMSDEELDQVPPELLLSLSQKQE